MYLLDTHALIWTLSAPERLSETAGKVIRNADNQLFVSIGSLWEITIKQSLGKLDFDQDIPAIAEECEKEGIHILPIQPEHLKEVGRLPFIHRDPFDRLYIGQAKSEGLTIITKDTIIPQYDVKTLW